MATAKDQKSDFYPWLTTMPNCASHPAFFSDDEKDLLKGSSLLAHINDKVKQLKENYETISQIKDFNFTYEEYCRATFMVLSRAFSFKAENEQGYAMIPLLDMVNHSSDCNVSQVYNYELKGYELVSNQKILSGQEVTINYGDQDQQNFLFNYGFIDDSHIRIPIRYSLENSEALYE